MVNITDNRKPIFDLAIVAMLTMQFLVVGLLAWRILVPGAETEPDANQAAADSYRYAVRDQAYNELLSSMVAAKGGDPAIVDDYAKLKLDQDRLLANLDGQIIRSEKLSGERDQVIKMLEEKQGELTDLAQRQEQSRNEIRDLRDKVNNMEAVANGTGTVLPFVLRWWHWTIGFLLAAAVFAGVYLMGQRTGINRAYYEMDADDDRRRRETKNSDSRERIALSLSEEPPPQEN